VRQRKCFWDACLLAIEHFPLRQTVDGEMVGYRDTLPTWTIDDLRLQATDRKIRRLLLSVERLTSVSVRGPDPIGRFALVSIARGCSSRIVAVLGEHRSHAC
jgi:hypothetical protein